ncbi:MAG: mandelate racemase [Betaproteobacteria bacterium]|nr:MAG: mandelate racemase [Betaproteobacteria bacterium]
MSTIDRVEVHEFAFELADVGWDAGKFNIVYQPDNRLSLSKYAVVIRTADGGRGEYVTLWGGTPMALGQTLALAPQLLGRNAHEREKIYDDFKRAHRQYDHMGFGCIDIALWDWAGKHFNAPVSRLLGGFRTKLPAYASTYHGDRNGGLSSPQAYVDFAEQCYEMGYRAFKVHGWCDGNVAEEVATVLALGKAFRGRMSLMIDPACELGTFAAALAVGRACDEAGFFWYEDPFRDAGWSQFAHRKLRQFIKTPLLQTEHVRGVEPKADFIVAEATDFVRADPEYDLGITGTMKIAHLAESFGLDVEIHASGPAHRHCMAAIRNTNFYEVALVGPKCNNAMPPVYTCGYSDELDAVDGDGCFDVPTRSGLGVAYDWDFINRKRSRLHIFE